MSTRTAVLSALAAGLLSLPVAAGETAQRFAQLQVGPLIGGQDLVVHLRSTEPGAFTALFVGVDATPTPLGPFKPVLGMGLPGSTLLLRLTDASGQDRVAVPTAPGAFGPSCTGLPLVFQTFVKPSTSSALLFASNVEAVEVEPVCAPVTPFLVDDSAARFPVGYDTLGAVDVQTLDVNRDGFEDLILGTELSLALWVNDGTGVFVDETAARLSYDGLPNGGVFVVDLDRDGHDDLVVAGGYDDFFSIPDRVWYADGFGGFVQDTSGAFPVDEGQTQDFVFRDVNGDGELDMLKCIAEEQHLGAPGGPDQLYLGTGAGGFVKDTAFESALWNVPGDRSINADAGDVDNDGDQDVVIAKADGVANLLLINDGTGGFSEEGSSRILPLWDDNSQDVALADLDLDGDLDMVVANSHFSWPANISGDLLYNDGTGVFTEDANSDLEISTPADTIRLSVYVEDVDADGDDDVLMGVHDLFAGADQLLFLNQGGAQGGTLGELTREFWFDPGDHITYGIAVFDADRDGDNDVVQVASGVVMGTPPGLKTFFYENTRL